MINFGTGFDAVLDRVSAVSTTEIQARGDKREGRKGKEGICIIHNKNKSEH